MIFFFFHLGHLTQNFPKKLGLIILNYFMPNLLPTFGNSGDHIVELLLGRVVNHIIDTYNTGIIIN